MTDWWIHNAKYVKAYAACIVMLIAFRVVVGFLHLNTLIAKPMKALGVSDSVAPWISAVIFGILFIAVGFYIFRNAVRKFIQKK